MGKRKLEVGIPTGSSHQRTGTIPAWSLMPGVSPRVLATLLLLIVSLAGCSIPIGVTKVDMTKAYRDINASALTGNELSSDTVIVLHRFYLLEQFELDPAKAIARLHAIAVTDQRRDLRFALSEMSFLYAKKLEAPRLDAQEGQPWQNARSGTASLSGYAPDYYLMSALYAYYYLLGPSAEEPPEAYDRRFRVACDLYNRSLAKAFATGKNGQLKFEDQVRELPVARLTISVKKKSVEWSLDQFKKFLPADNYRVHGLSVRDRTPGLGLPLIAILKKTPQLPGETAIPATAFMQVMGGIVDKEQDSVKASLEFYSGFDDPEVTVGTRKVPLETDTTTPLAYKLNDPSLWSELGVSRFLTPRSTKSVLVLSQPYEPGRVPVVFVHGTASNPLWWAEMLNTLRSDPILKKRCQFWFFMYNSNQPILISGDELRVHLNSEIRKLDPSGTDPALRNMVVIGHSQGGLLTKLTVVQPGDKLWQALSDKKFDQLDLTPDLRKQIKTLFFFEPVPSVKRVVFISTPHRGSFLTTGFVRNLMRRLINLPGDVYQKTTSFLSQNEDKLKLPAELKGKIPTSIDGMSPTNPVLMALADLPIVPGVKANSIIAVEGDGDFHTGNDGVVEYTSAHLDGVESEFIVRSGHSCQDNPVTIEEVRRILLEHLASLPMRVTVR
jgi:pimeloyl-ACP methyl ester carboxylesterase